jgi:hypothetical protein
MHIIYMCRLRHTSINDSVLSSLKMKGTRLFFNAVFASAVTREEGGA